MAQITPATGYAKESIRIRSDAGFTRLREMLDAFVSHRMRLAVAEAEHASARQPENPPPPSTNAQ